MKPEPDEIDRIMAQAMGETLFGYTPEPDSEPNAWATCLGGAANIRATLLRAGYAIVLDEAQLLEKGREVKLK